MSCNYPVQAYRRPFGGVTFRASEGTVPVKLPCGQCMGCRLDHAQSWAIRAVHESIMHKENCFITLTYNPEQLPADLSLHHEHFQLFMKRLRYETGKKLTYLMCGEYGPAGDRPHYHALIFGYDFHDKTEALIKNGKVIYTSPQLEKLWGLGFVTVDEVNYKTAQYVAGYIRKKQKGKNTKIINPDTGLKAYELYDDSTGEIIIRKPEYAQMSRNPAVGKRFYEKYGDQIRNHDFVVVDGKRMRTPTYYDRLTERHSKDRLDAIKQQRRNKAARHSSNNTPERLAAREAFKLALVNTNHKDTKL